MKQSTVTQRMVNGFPDWSAIRSDQQSLGFQLVNVAGNLIQDVDEQVQKSGLNYYVPTMNLDEIDVVYTHELDKSFLFDVDESDPTNPIYTPPTVEGDISGTWYKTNGTPIVSPVTVTQPEDNDIKSFWYDRLPSRVRSTFNTTAADTILAATPVSSSPILSGFVLPHTDGRIWVQISGAGLLTRLDGDNLIRGLVTISGTTRRGTEEDETIVFLYNDIRQSTKEWKEIKTLRVFDVQPSTATVAVFSGRFASGPHLDAYNLSHGASGSKVDTFWGKSDDNLALEIQRYTSEDPRNLILGRTQKEAIRAFDLQDTSGVATGVLDVAVQPFSHNIWTLHGNFIRAYTDEQPYPNMKNATLKDYDAIARLEPDYYYRRLNESVEFVFRLVRPIKEVLRHRLIQKKPNGTVVTGPWTDGIQPDGKYLKAPETIVLDQYGEWLFTLEVEFTDATTQYDQRIVTVDVKRAVEQYWVAAICSPNTPSSISFDSDQNLWLKDNTGKKYKLEFAFDSMLVDYDNKLIYFRDNYTDIEVTA